MKKTISQKIDPANLPSKFQVYWALDYLENEKGKDRFSVREVLNCLVEDKSIDISRQHVNGILTKSKGAVNNGLTGFKLMEKGKNELKNFTNKSEQSNDSNILKSNYLSSYKLHPKIEQVSIVPFQAKLYKESIQNALVEVISEVKIKTGNPKDPQGKDLDGDKLMQHVFGCDNQQPLIKFNSLNNSLDSAEQRGLMNLFKGIVGIRDRKAHLNFIQKDPERAFEYLVLASLLLKLVDENTTS